MTGKRKIIGLTGSFCSGKTTVASFFKELGAHVIDADKIVHSLYKTDKKIKNAVLKNFGRRVFVQGSIDRMKLARIAFGNRKNLYKLQEVIHPKVITKIKEQARTTKRPIIVIDAPLLIETGLAKFIDYIVVVKATLKRQIERCRAKGFSRSDILLRQELQIPLREKIKYANFVIDNNRSRRYAKKEVERIWKELTQEVKDG